MKIIRRDKINASALDAFLVLRDKMSDFVVYLPNVDKVEVESRKENSGIVETRLRWYGKTEIPDVAKKFLKPEYLSWIDVASWNETDCSVAYKLSSPVVGGLLNVGGRNKFVKISDTVSELHIDCEVEIHPEKIPGLPRFMASLAKKPIEEVIKKMFEPNLSRLADGLNRYFA